MSYDTSQTTETQLWIDNDESLHRRKWFCFANLAKKVRKGIFDAKKAEKLFRYLCDEAARRYKKEIGTPLAMEDRRQAEKDLVTDFLAHSRLDSFARDLEANIKPPTFGNVALRQGAERRAHVDPNPTIAPGVLRGSYNVQVLSKGRWTDYAINKSGVEADSIRDELLADPTRPSILSVRVVPTPGAGKHDPAGQSPTMIVASPPPAETIRAYAKRQARKGRR